MRTGIGLRTLLRDVMLHLQGDAEQLEQAEQDLRTIGGDKYRTKWLALGFAAGGLCIGLGLHALAIWLGDAGPTWGRVT